MGNSQNLVILTVAWLILKIFRTENRKPYNHSKFFEGVSLYVRFNKLEDHFLLNLWRLSYSFQRFGSEIFRM